jgi:hypothetical protein
MNDPGLAPLPPYTARGDRHRVTSNGALDSLARSEMSEQPSNWLDRATGAVGLLAGITATLTWFLGDVPRIARLALAAVACGALIVVALPRGSRRRYMYAAVPVLCFAALSILPATRAWLLEREDSGSRALRGPPLAVEDVRPSWEPRPAAPVRFRLSIVVRNRAAEPVVINRALLGYHQGGGAVGGQSDDIWLKDAAVLVHESDSQRTLELSQSEAGEGKFVHPVVAFAKWFAGGSWDQVVELRPQLTVPARGVRVLRVTMPLWLRVDAIRTFEGEETRVKRADRGFKFFARFNEPSFDRFPRILTVTVNATNGGCASHVTILEPGTSTTSSKPRVRAFLDKPVAFGDLCGWSPPAPPT